jgi:hypothetical protein
LYNLFECHLVGWKKPLALERMTAPTQTASSSTAESVSMLAGSCRSLQARGLKGDPAKAAIH